MNVSLSLQKVTTKIGQFVYFLDTCLRVRDDHGIVSCGIKMPRQGKYVHPIIQVSKAIRSNSQKAQIELYLLKSPASGLL